MKETGSYVGLVFAGQAGTMTKGDDMVLFFANGEDSSFGDYTSNGKTKPTKDA